MDDFSFMKSGQNLLETDESSLSTEEIAAVAVPFLVYLRKALEACDLYVCHSGRATVLPKDIEYCLKYTAQNLESILQSERVKDEMMKTYSEIVTDLDEEAPYSDHSDFEEGSEEEEGKIGGDEQLSHEEQKVSFKNTMESIYPILRHYGLSANEAAAKAVELSRRGMQKELENEFCKSECPCKLCTDIHKAVDEWDDWQPATIRETHLKTSIEKMCISINNGS